MIAAPAMAHHPFGGQAPDNVFAGLLSGVGHPVLGFDHLAFVIAIGLLAAVLNRGITVLLAFLLAAVAGTGLHLAAVTLPASEWVISASVLLFGLLLVTRQRLSTPAVVALVALAGMFHGYAYGEAIVGAEPTPLVAYLIGLTGVQGAIAGAAYWVSKRALVGDLAQQPQPHGDGMTSNITSDMTSNITSGIASIRQAGFAICGAGAVLLGNLLV